MSARWNERPSLARPMFLASQYDLGQSLQFGRLVLTHNGFRYRNELVAKLILLGVQFPIDGLCNMTSSLIYDLTSSEKSLIVTLDNAVQHYDETTARVSMAQEAGLATLHVQTPVPSWEEIDLSAGFDLAKKTAFVLSERNGQSIVFLQGLATLPAMSSIVSGAVRLPLSLPNEDVELMAAYNMAAESADAKFKFCSHQVLFDGKRTQDWATLSTTFKQLQTAQIDFFPLERQENRPGRTCSKHSRSFRQGNAVRSVAGHPHGHRKRNGICCPSNSQAGRIHERPKPLDLGPALQSTSSVVVNASLNGPSLDSELKFQGRCDTNSGLNSSSVFSWAEDKVIRASVSMSPSELSTPFAGLETTRLSLK